MRAGWLVAAMALLATSAGADVVDVRQGTNISVTADPSGQLLLVDLLGGLWRLPVAGGGATMLMAPGSGISQPRFAADGRRAVVERRVNGQSDLWLLDLTSGTWEQLTDSPYTERQPDFLPGDSGIVFTSDRSGRDQLWSLDLGTRALRQLTDEDGASRFPAARPDGVIAYVNENSGTHSLRVLTLGPVGSTVESSAKAIAAPSWRPGSAGPVIVYNVRDAQNSDLAVLIDADIRINRRLTANEDVFVGRVAWLGPAEFVYAADGQLWRRQIASKERRPVHMFAGVSVERAAAPEHSPQPDAPGPFRVAGIRDVARRADDDRIVFAALGDIWLARGRNVQQLTDDPAVDVEPVLLPDSPTVLFLSDRAGSFGLWRLDTATRNVTAVAGTQGGAANLIVTADGRTAYFVSTGGTGDTTVSRVLRAEPADGTARVDTIAGPFAGVATLTASADGLRVTVPGEPTVRDIPLTHSGALLPDRTDATDELPSGVADLTWTVPAADPLVIRAGRLFDGIRNEYRRHVDIHTEGGRITAIVGRDRLPAGGRILDFSDATVMPGMVDVHAHHADNTGQTVGLAWLLRGVTTVREIATNALAATERAEAWGSGRRPGPRLVISTIYRELPTDVTGGPITPVPADPVSSGFLHALAGPSGGDVSLPAGLAAEWPAGGIATPLSPLKTTYQDTLALLGGTGGYLSTGLTAALERLGLGDTRRYAATQLTSIVERAQRSFGRVAIGSDAPLVPYGDGYLSELETLSRAGVPTAQVLRWATAGGAMALGLDGHIGTLEAGKLADLVVVDGDPLARIGDLRNVAMVMRGGTVVFGSVER